jgi:hypothetical protein
VRVRVSGTFALTFLLLAIVSGYAQVASPTPPPIPGFVSPYEIMHTLRSAGFDPLAPPLREGTTYVARATDYRGILMRVVLDARTGAIRDANRIVPGPGAYGFGPYGEAGMLPPRDGMPPPYDPPPGFDSEESSLDGQGAATLSAPSGPHQATRAAVTIFPPLPRPRPAELASRISSDAPAAKPDAKPMATIDPKPDAKADVTNTIAPAAPAPAKPGKTQAGPPIND